MRIGGLQRLTLIDYPGRVACTVFLFGCNFKCPWCYSPELVLPEEKKEDYGISEEEFFSFLRKRKGKLEAVVVCGGEPTIYKELSSFIEKIKEEGFLVKVDTNGSNPKALKNLVKEDLVDYIAMDIKLPLSSYKEVAGEEFDENKIRESIEFLLQEKIDYEFRTTVVPGIHGKEEIKEIGKEIKGAKTYFLQNFLPEKTIDKSLLKTKPFSPEDLDELKKVAEKFVEICKTR